MLAEDNDLNAEIAIELLQTQGAEVYRAENGKQALELFRDSPEGTFQVILMDIMMPEMSGDELCAAIKGNIETSHIPVLLLTALGDEKNMLEGLKIGADDYMAKPFSISILKASINRLITNRILLHKKYGSSDFETEKHGRSGFYGRYALFASPHEPQ